jgi:hypothetical protein
MPGSGGLFLTESNSANANDFFGFAAGTSNTSGYSNAFFGTEAGRNNRSGDSNGFFGRKAGFKNVSGRVNIFAGAFAGYNNSSGSRNAFFGAQSGYSNTIENDNTMVGAFADINPGSNPASSPVTNATAVGNRSIVSKSNSLVLGSIEGLNGASESVNVGIGTSAPLAPLHISRDDGTAKFLVKNTATKAFAANMFELNNFGPVQFHMINRQTGIDWTFRNNFQKKFTIQAVGAKIQFALDKRGNLEITGDFTAKGVVYSSDRDRKENLKEVNSQEVLEKLVAVPVTEWNFKQENIRHIGPMAQDFYAAFGVGKDNKHLNPTDTAGVMIAAIQGLYQQLREKEKEIQDLKTELKEFGTLKTRLIRLEHLLDSFSGGWMASNED